MPAYARRRALLAHLRQQVDKVLGSGSSDHIPATTPLQERGLDSLMSVELRNLLAKSLRLSLPATLMLDYPTLDAVCEYLMSRHFASSDVAKERDDAEMIADLSDAEAETALRNEIECLDV